MVSSNFRSVSSYFRFVSAFFKSLKNLNFRFGFFQKLLKSEFVRWFPQNGPFPLFTKTLKISYGWPVSAFYKNFKNLLLLFIHLLSFRLVLIHSWVLIKKRLAKRERGCRATMTSGPSWCIKYFPSPAKLSPSLCNSVSMACILVSNFTITEKLFFQIDSTFK